MSTGHAVIGNQYGIAAASRVNGGLLASITADNVTDNVVDVNTAVDLRVGMSIDILVATTGAGTAKNRLIESISGLEVTYSGADVDVDNTYKIYTTGNWAAGSDPGAFPPHHGYVNLNGGPSAEIGFYMTDGASVAEMRQALVAVGVETKHMTDNDVLFAFRLTNTNASIESFGVTPAIAALLD